MCFIFTNSYGIAPSNTTLTVRYLTGGGVSSNINAGQLNSIVSSNISFVTSQISDTSLAQYVFDSVAVNNPIAASGGQDGDSIEEIRQNALSNFNTQLRNVTADHLAGLLPEEIEDPRPWCEIISFSPTTKIIVNLKIVLKPMFLSENSIKINFRRRLSSYFNNV